MGLLQRFRELLRHSRRDPITQDSSGIALFMVLASVSLLALLVTEFTYIAQINQKIAFDGLDNLKAHYLAKSGLKLSLLRLKAYQNVKSALGNTAGGAASALVPKQMLEKIWNFPFFYPIPTSIPGLSATDKDAIDKFQKASGLEGKFSSVIESESSKLNLNLILPTFAPSARPQAAASPNTAGGASPTPMPSYDPEAARTGLRTTLSRMLTSKFESDPDFAAEYRDFRIDDFMDGLLAWADQTYERRTGNSREAVPMKRAPFYSVSELHMLPMMTDDLYNLWAPALTASSTSGINVNVLTETVLRALFPLISSEEEVKKFFDFRDSLEQDNTFKTVDDFYRAVSTHFTPYQDASLVEQLKQEFARRGIHFITDESSFKITVQAQVNQSIRTIVAWVTLNPPAPPVGVSAGNASTAVAGSSFEPTRVPAPDTGLRVIFMRIL